MLLFNHAVQNNIKRTRDLTPYTWYIPQSTCVTIICPYYDYSLQDAKLYLYWSRYFNANMNGGECTMSVNEYSL